MQMIFYVVCICQYRINQSTHPQGAEERIDFYLRCRTYVIEFMCSIGSIWSVCTRIIGFMVSDPRQEKQQALAPAGATETDAILASRCNRLPFAFTSLCFCGRIAELSPAPATPFAGLTRALPEPHPARVPQSYGWQDGGGPPSRSYVEWSVC
jgi:hypothetical protein